METSYQFYKVIHVVSIVLFFSLYAMYAAKGKSSKKEMIITGIPLILILVAGMGLIAKLGIPHGSPWPLWIKFKLVIWIIIGSLGHMILKRFPQHALKFFWVCVGLLTLASYFANYKVPM